MTVVAHEDEVAEVPSDLRGLNRSTSAFRGGSSVRPLAWAVTGRRRDGSLVSHGGGRMSPEVSGARLLLSCSWS